MPNDMTAPVNIDDLLRQVRGHLAVLEELATMKAERTDDDIEMWEGIATIARTSGRDLDAAQEAYLYEHNRLYAIEHPESPTVRAMRREGRQQGGAR